MSAVVYADGELPMVGDTCPRCESRPVAAGENNEPFSLCDVCATIDAAQEKLGLEVSGSFGVGYHTTDLCLHIQICDCGCGEVYLGNVLLDGFPFIGKIKAMVKKGSVAHYGGPRSEEMDQL